MTDRPDSLVPLLFPPPDNPLGFHSGVVESWNPDNGENTVSVAGALLVNVPILNTGEASVLRAGHVVGMLRFASTYFILGRVTVPGGPDFASASVAFDSDIAVDTNFSISTSPTVPVNDFLTVPAWADEAVVSMTASLSAFNTSGVNDFVTLRPTIESTVSGGVIGQAGNNEFATITVGFNDTLTDPGSAIAFGAEVSTSGGTWPAHPSTTMHITGLALFRATV